ncbi:MAG: DUF3800 domain-containing protein [Acidobacteriota bacterium]|nr:DUF3800 domain-containing protein [Acidobacteriota bacterium]
MHLLYLDESGNPDDPADKHFILAGLSAFEKNTHFLSTEADGVQLKHFPGSPPVDFHAQHIRSGKGFWRGQEKTVRDHVLDDLASIIDYVAHALFLLYEKNDASLARSVIKKFDQADGILHGLVHVSDHRGAACNCPACFSRRTPWQWGPWVA